MGDNQEDRMSELSDKYRCYDTDNQETEDAVEIDSKPSNHPDILVRLMHKWATDAENAAEIFAEKDDMDSGEYDYARGDKARVTVISPDGTESVFKIDGWYEPQYSATLIKPTNPSPTENNADNG